jgi:hypothetical protein
MISESYAVEGPSLTAREPASHTRRGVSGLVDPRQSTVSVKLHSVTASVGNSSPGRGVAVIVTVQVELSPLGAWLIVVVSSTLPVSSAPRMTSSSAAQS